MANKTSEGKIGNCTKENNSFPCLIPAQRVLNLISRKWSIQLIYILKEGKRVRYKNLKAQLHRGWKKGKISDATLSSRLAELAEEGLIAREVFTEIPPKVEYYLSEKGQMLSEAITPLVDWTIKNCHEEN